MEPDERTNPEGGVEGVNVSVKRVDCGVFRKLFQNKPSFWNMSNFQTQQKTHFAGTSTPKRKKPCTGTPSIRNWAHPNGTPPHARKGSGSTAQMRNRTLSHPST